MNLPGRRLRCRRQRLGQATDVGQAAVEFALILPLFVLLIVALFDVVAIVRDQLLVDVLARDAARQASQSINQVEARAVITDTVDNADRSDARWQLRVHDDVVTVQVRLVPRASMLASSLRWLGSTPYVVGIATFATEYDIDDG